MQAFVEHLCPHCGLVRVGPDAAVLGDDYLYSVAYVIEWVGELGLFAVPKGFDHKNLEQSEAELIVRKINEASGKLVAYWRKRPRPHWLAQIPPDETGGRIAMKRIKI
ncbi:MAG TPA: hypothetical protein VGH23_16075 [Rhizomicrobium sp.]